MNHLVRLTLVCLGVGSASSDAHAIRFTLGLSGQVTPIIFDEGIPFEFGRGTRLGLRPVLEVEALPWLAFDTYAPFALYRTDATGPASSGGESVFGVGISGRLRDVSPDKRETLKYARIRGGFATQEGRAGPYASMAFGYAKTWLDTGRGWFAELEGGHVSIDSRAGLDLVDRWLVGVSIGVVFRLGGERWDL